MKSFLEFGASILTEMPRIIKPIKNSENKVNSLWERLKQNNSYSEINDFPLNGYHLVEFDRQMLLILPDWSKCVYYVNFEQVNSIDGNPVRQVYVWRQRENVLPAITNIVFWKILLKRYECIVTDTTQTILGKEFWLRRIPEAFDFGFSVFRYNHRTKVKTILKDMKDVYDSDKEIWGSTSKHENELVLICRK